MRRWRRSGVMVGASLFLCAPCLASVTATASATARVEYNSNVFDLQGGFAVPGTQGFGRSDTLYTYGADFDLNYLISEQKLFAILSASEFRYDRFTELNHNEYNLDGGWEWRLGALLDGILEVRRNHIMVPFTNLNVAQFVLQTEQRESGKAGLEITPEWRFQTDGYYRTVDQAFEVPIHLTESEGEAGMRYLGVAGLTAGLSGGYTFGNYSGASAAYNPSYKQSNVALVATYEPTGRSIFDGNIGYSNRTSVSSVNAISGVTGTLDYSNQLTGLTSVHVVLSRIINNYIANTGSEVDSTASLLLNWQATFKLGLLGGYTFMNRELPGQGNAPIGSTRTDHVQTVSLKADYEPLRWLTLKPYVSLQTRSSNFVGGNFNATVYGIYFTVKWESQPRQQRVYRHQNGPEQP